jgi:hypothetical protein
MANLDGCYAKSGGTHHPACECREDAIAYAAKLARWLIEAIQEGRNIPPGILQGAGELLAALDKVEPPKKKHQAPKALAPQAGQDESTPLNKPGTR